MRRRTGEDKALKAAPVSGGIASHPAIGQVSRVNVTQLAPIDPAAFVNAVTAKALESLEDAKAEDIVSLDLQGKTSLADVMVVASGRSNVHVGAIADRLLKALKDAGCPPPRVQGMPHNDWVLVDTGDLIIHLFRPEVRQFYNLEKLWGADRPAERHAV